MSMQPFLEAIQSGASGDEIAALPIPESYRAAHVLRSEQDMWEGIESDDKDPRKSLHVGEVPTPELAPDEVYLAVMASSINFNTVWTSIFEPLSTFGFLDRLGKESVWGARHALDHHVVGSDASAVVLRIGSAVRNWKPGDRVTVHCNYLDDQDPSAHDDSMLAANQRIWGFESNFGGLADLSIVKANQLMPMPTHLTWEEAAVNALLRLDQLPDARRPPRRADATGRERVRVGGDRVASAPTPSNSCSTAVARRSASCRRSTGWSCCRRWGARRPSTAAPRAISSGPTSTPRTSASGVAWARRCATSSATTPTSSSSTPGRQTMGASVFIAKRGGTIVTCAATSGFMIEYDNRHLWMKLKRIVSSHFANYQEAWNMNRLIDQGRIHPVMSKVYSLEDVGEAANAVHKNEAEGKLGVLCLSPEPGLGIRTPRSASASARTRSRCSSATRGQALGRPGLLRGRPPTGSNMIVIDGNNVMGAGAGGWWNDPPAAAAS